MIKLPEEIREIIKRIEDLGEEAYLVGGAVRNSILQLPVKDYDIATSMTPDETEEAFREYKTIDIGKKFGTILVIYKGERVEITSFRRDGNYIDGRRPETVSFTKDLKEDLKRRDFTMNALAYNENLGIIDYFSGIEDIKQSLVRAVGQADKRIEEDYLRILRAVRFATEYDFEIEENTYAACKKYGDRLNLISSERVREEFFKILMAKKPSRGIELLRRLDILKIILPELDKAYGFKQNNPHHKKDVYYHSLEVLDRSPRELELRLAAIFHDLGKLYSYSEDEDGIGHFYNHHSLSAEIVEERLRNLNSPRGLINSVKNLVYYHMIDLKNFKDKGRKRLIANLGEEDVFKLLELIRADRLSTEEPDLESIDEMEDRLVDILNSKEVYNKKQLAINGRDVIELGYNEGKIIGEILSFCMDIVLEDNSLNNRDYLIEAISNRYGGNV